MNTPDIVIGAIIYLFIGVFWLVKFGIHTVGSIIMIEVSGYKLYGALMRLLCLLLWPIHSIVSTLMLLAYMKYKKIPIKKE